MRQIKVVLIGAGSASFGRGAIVDLLSNQLLGEVDLTVHLVDIDPKALQRMQRLSEVLKQRLGSRATIRATTDRKEALPGADYVVVSVSVNRWKLWEKDFYIPAVYGFKHVNGENGGPGGAFHTLRSLRLVVPIAKDMEKLCPDALLINYTNPESRVILAISKLTKIRSVGLCHGVFKTLEGIASVLSMPESDIDLTIAGINHFHWAIGIKDAKTGKDLKPIFDEKMRSADFGFDAATKVFYEVFGYLTYPAQSHPCEYVAFGHNVAGPAILHWGIGEVARNLRDTADDLNYILDGTANSASYELWSYDNARKIEAAAAGDEATLKELEEPTGELMANIITDIEFDRKRKEISVNVPNSNHAIPNLQPDVIVEVPAIVDKNGVTPVEVGPLPDGLAGLCQLQANIQNLLVQAYQEESKNLLLQALVVDPVVDNVKAARDMMEHMIRVEAEYLPPLK